MYNFNALPQSRADQIDSLARGGPGAASRQTGRLTDVVPPPTFAQSARAGMAPPEHPSAEYHEAPAWASLVAIALFCGCVAVFAALLSGA